MLLTSLWGFSCFIYSGTFDSKLKESQSHYTSELCGSGTKFPIYTDLCQYFPSPLVWWIDDMEIERRH